MSTTDSWIYFCWFSCWLVLSENCKCFAERSYFSWFPCFSGFACCAERLPAWVCCVPGVRKNSQTWIARIREKPWKRQFSARRFSGNRRFPSFCWVRFQWSLENFPECVGSFPLFLPFFSSGPPAAAFYSLEITGVKNCTLYAKIGAHDLFDQRFFVLVLDIFLGNGLAQILHALIGRNLQGYLFSNHQSFVADKSYL